MPKAKQGKKPEIKHLEMTDVVSVDDQGAVVADAMKVIAAEVRVSEMDPDSNKPITVQILDLPILGAQLEVRTFAPYKGNANCLSIGKTSVFNKWHPHSHWKIMGILNAAASARLGHYAVVEEGVHLMHTVKELATGKLYEGNFGYVDFEKASPEWVAFFEGKGIKHTTGKTGWLRAAITDDGDLFNGGYIAKKERLIDVAQRLGKSSTDELSPVAIDFWTKGRNTQNKRRGLEALLRAAKDELRIIPSLQLANEGAKWQIAVEFDRSLALFGSLEELAKIMNGAAGRGNGQRDVEQGGYILRQAPEGLAAKVQKLGDLVTYGGKTYTAEQLKRASVIQMTGDMEVGGNLFLRDVASVVHAFETRVNLKEGKTLKVLKIDGVTVS